jgi:Site-specific recombinase XerD
MENENSSLPTAESKRNPAASYLSGLGSASSRTTLGHCLNQIAKTLGQDGYESADWSKLKRCHWQKVQNELKLRGCCGATINLYLNAFKAVAREAWSIDQLPQTAYLKIRSIKNTQYERLPKGRSLSVTECRLLLEACADGSNQGARDKAIFAVMMGCGLRRAEIVQLQMQNWDCLSRSFKFVGKGNKERQVFLPKSFDKCIDDWLIVRGLQSGVFFPRMRPGASPNKFLFHHMLPSSIYKILSKRADFAGLGKIRPHDLRRTFATRMLEGGADVFLLQQAMGHSSAATTARYDYRSNDMRKKKCRSLLF